MGLQPFPSKAVPAGARRSSIHDESSKQAGLGRLISDIRAAKVGLLSVQCATDRLHLQYSVADIVSFGEPQTPKGAIASASALYRFFAFIEDQMKQAEQRE